MSFGLLNAAMLIGVLGASAPVVIHWLNRRRDPVIEWGAMQFLELGRRARQKLRFTELLLMLARMAVLAVVALALARPYQGGGAAVTAARGGPSRDVVLIIDASTTMDRSLGGTTPKAQALRWARQFVDKLSPGSSVAVLAAGDRVQPRVDPPSFDKVKVTEALSTLERLPSRGSSNLPSALAEAFLVLERMQNPARDVVILTDGHRAPWHSGEPARWALVRDLHRRLPIPPRLWSVAFDLKTSANDDVAPNGTVGLLTVSRALVTPEMPLVVTADLANAGPGPLTRTAELLVDGQLVQGSAKVVGPVPEGGRTPLEFKTTLTSIGSHLLTVRLTGADDALPGDDEASVAIEVAPALGVLLVDGEPSSEPFGGETDFLRAALAPGGDDTPRARASVVGLDRFTAESLRGQSVVVLANVERLSLDQTTAVETFLRDGGGVLVAPGDRTDASYFNGQGWLPAKLGERTGDFAARKAVAHPAPSTFSGSVLAPLRKGDSPALASAGLFAYWRLEPVPGGSVSAKLNTGEPWIVERAHGKGRVLVVAGPLDAEGGTLPVNPDFVPLVHEWAFALAGGAEPRAVKPGETLVFELNPVPDASVRSLPIVTPSGQARAVVTRASGLARARFDDTVESGVYRLTLPDPPGGIAYATVASDSKGSDPSPLDPAEAATLAEGWPLTFASDPAQLPEMLLADAGSKGRRELWRILVIAALAGLCVEIYLTRRLVRGQGVPEAS